MRLIGGFIASIAALAAPFLPTCAQAQIRPAPQAPAAMATRAGGVQAAGAPAATQRNAQTPLDPDSEPVGNVFVEELETQALINKEERADARPIRRQGADGQTPRVCETCLPPQPH